ncbi:hypothetical protein ACQ4LE_004323 [Meloidogyne hapla]
MFFAKVELDVINVSKQNIYYFKDLEQSELNINGIYSYMVIETNIPYKLTKLICFLNPEGHRKILKREKFVKNKLIESHSLKGKKHEEKMEYSNIEICLKFKNKGNYYINVNGNYDSDLWLRFPLKVKEANKEKCVNKMFWKIDELEKIFLQNLRKDLIIFVGISGDDELENDKMILYNEDLKSKYPDLQYVLNISPIINEGIYEFYLDKDGITKEKVKKIEANNKIVNFENYKEENDNKKKKLF